MAHTQCTMHNDIVRESGEAISGDHELSHATPTPLRRNSPTRRNLARVNYTVGRRLVCTSRRRGDGPTATVNTSREHV
jgi:hypothetical protein